MLNTAAMWPRNLPKALDGQEKSVAAQFASGRRPDGTPLTPQLRKQITLELQQIRDLVAEQLKVRRTFPTLTYTDRLTLRHGGRELQFMSVTGDAGGTTILYLPTEKILITGDTISYPLPYFTPPLSEHAKSIRQLLALDATTIVPGHGPAFHDKSFMILEADLFDEVLRQTEAALRGTAVTIDEVQARVDLSRFRDRFAKGDPDLAKQFDGYRRRDGAKSVHRTSRYQGDPLITAVPTCMRWGSAVAPSAEALHDRRNGQAHDQPDLDQAARRRAHRPLQQSAGQRAVDRGPPGAGRCDCRGRGRR